MSSETVKVTYPNPQQAVLEATLDSPGLVVLADVYYPGWELRSTANQPHLSGQRCDAGSRGLFRPPSACLHISPQSFRVGGLVSLACLAALLIFGVVARWPVDPVLGQHGQSGSDPLTSAGNSHIGAWQTPTCGKSG